MDRYKLRHDKQKGYCVIKILDDGTRIEVTKYYKRLGSLQQYFYKETGLWIR